MWDEVPHFTWGKKSLGPPFVQIPYRETVLSEMKIILWVRIFLIFEILSKPLPLTFISVLNSVLVVFITEIVREKKSGLYSHESFIFLLRLIKKVSLLWCSWKSGMWIWRKRKGIVGLKRECPRQVEMAPLSFSNPLLDDDFVEGIGPPYIKGKTRSSDRHPS